MITEIQHKSLGMASEVFDPLGKNIEHTGEPGELVCTKPHPSLPVRFWGDTADGKKLRETYFSFFPGEFPHCSLLSQQDKLRPNRYLAPRRLYGGQPSNQGNHDLGQKVCLFPPFLSIIGETDVYFLVTVS